MKGTARLCNVYMYDTNHNFTLDLPAMYVCEMKVTIEGSEECLHVCI